MEIKVQCSHGLDIGMRSVPQNSKTKCQRRIRIIFCLAIAFVLAARHSLALAQSSAPHNESDLSHSSTWRMASSKRPEFDVASIRMSKPDTFLRPNMVLNSEDTPVPPGGHFIADFPLEIYIEFAYKIMPTREQEQAMLAHLPKWVSTEHFVIQAEFTGHPGKDQIRLMMQSLLAARFKLLLHFEIHEMPVLALVLDKPGKLGPTLRSHSQGPPCEATLTVSEGRNSPNIAPGAFISNCGRVQVFNGPNHTVLLGGRDISIDHLAGYLSDFEDLGRPVVDQTGLNGAFDFSLRWLPDQSADSPGGNDGQQDAQSPPLAEALKEQLGLKLKATKAPIQILVIDHVEPPTPN
jgi:bla regulator protein blaR1